jgi:hypothetical protein
MPQEVVSGQIFCPLARGPRHAGQKVTLDLISKLALQFGHLTFMSLILLSLPMGDTSASWKRQRGVYLQGGCQVDPRESWIRDRTGASLALWPTECLIVPAPSGA